MASIDVLGTSAESMLYLERYVNNGSPSGFTWRHTSSPGTRPSDSFEPFEIPIFDCTSCGIKSFGVAPSVLPPGHLPVHPDMARLFAETTGLQPKLTIWAMPTSSARTLYVWCPDGQRGFLKLSYHGLLGRLTREMSEIQVSTTIEVSAAYADAIDRGAMPSSFHLFPEDRGAAFDATNDFGLAGWGYVQRSVEIKPLHEATVLVPSFSLFAKDRLNPLDDTLLAQLQARTWKFPPDLLLSTIFAPLVNCYFSSLIELGLQIEAHSQNVVAVFDPEFTLCGFAFRDMESVDRDLPLMLSRGIQPTLSDYTYKCLRASDYNYQIMHSFMYDFKFGEYLLEPLVQECARISDRPASFFYGGIVEIARPLIADLPDDFFPQDAWYDYAPKVFDRAAKREYQAHPSPKFRPHSASTP